MSTFFDLIANGISCIGYGLLISIVIIAILCVILSSIKKDTLKSIPFVISLAVLFVVLLINMSIMVGAIKIKGIANQSIDAIDQFTEALSNNINDAGRLIQNGDYIGAAQQVGEASDEVDFNNLLDLKNQLGDNWDLLKQYFDSSDMSVTMLFLSPTKTIKKFNGKMNRVIVGNILWSLLFIGIAAFISLRNFGGADKYKKKKSVYISPYSRQQDDF